MNTDTPTPRTDAAAWPETDLVEGNFARQLESELTAVTEQRDEALSDLEFRRDLFVLQEQQLNDVRAERDRLAEALNDLWHRHSLTEAAYELIEKSLATLQPQPLKTR